MLSTNLVLLIFAALLSVCIEGTVKLNDGALTVPCGMIPYDADEDGLITEEEVEAFFMSEGYREKAAKNWRASFFDQFDLNHDHLVQVEEFYLDKGYQKDCILSALMKG
ncbi:uncharacterized protein [Argopecten irradians]|uniref:uncharacterized protein n=1 Tax=Argopecten irradians TaxID=31199 RepID=UPI003723BA19